MIFIERGQDSIFYPLLLWDRDTPHLSIDLRAVISAGCDPTSNYLKSNLQFFNINSTPFHLV